jgi:hypothetical protein
MTIQTANEMKEGTKGILAKALGKAGFAWLCFLSPCFFSSGFPLPVYRFGSWSSKD